MNRYRTLACLDRADKVIERIPCRISADNMLDTGIGKVLGKKEARKIYGRFKIVQSAGQYWPAWTSIDDLYHETECAEYPVDTEYTLATSSVRVRFKRRKR